MTVSGAELLERRADADLEAALRDLARRLERRRGTPVRLEVHGVRTPVPPRHARALFLFAREALAGMEVDARASVVVLVLTYDRVAFSVSIRDDGTGLAHRDPFASRPDRGLGLARLRQLVEPVGGRVVVRNLRPHGVSVECRVTSQ